jgi:hypothetical protein
MIGICLRVTTEKSRTVDGSVSLKEGDCRGHVVLIDFDIID